MNDLNNCIFGEDWQNDKDSDKYIKGVELSFTKEMFLENIKNDAYKIYTLEWLNKAFILISLANNNLLFYKSNILYPVNQNKDTFYIVAIVGRIAYIRGVLTCRYGKEDKYEIDYLKEANFIIYEGDGND